MAARTPICLPATIHDPTDARAVEANGWRTNTDHPILARPVLVSQSNADGRHTPKAIQATQVVTNECDNWGGDSESDGINQIDCVEALYRVCRREGYQMKPQNESSVDGIRVPRQDTDQHGMTGVLSAIKRGYHSFKFV